MQGKWKLIIPFNNAMDLFADSDFQLSFGFTYIILTTGAGQHVDHPSGITVNEVVNLKFLLPIRVVEHIRPIHILAYCASATGVHALQRWQIRQPVQGN